MDQDYCRTHGYPVIRREVGGGAVYLDGNQLFTQWIFQAEHLPATVEARFACIRALVRAYRAMGSRRRTDRSMTSMSMVGRSGHGAARMDRAEVVVGSLCSTSTS